MPTQAMLTTIDNPYSPFNEFDQWFLFDVEHGYNTCAILARVTNIEEDMTDEEVMIETERAIDSIISNDFLQIRVKVYNNDPVLAENINNIVTV